MNNARTMFNELGFELYNSGEDFLLYKYETDYEEIVVFFDLENKSYYTTYSRFVDQQRKGFCSYERKTAKHEAQLLLRSLASGIWKRNRC